MKLLKMKHYVSMLKMKHYVGIVGVCITTVGWLLSNASEYQLVYRIVAPKYSMATSTLHRMEEKNFMLKEGDDGFREISEIVKGYFEETIGREIAYIKTVRQGGDVVEKPDRTEWDPYLELEVSFSNEPVFTGKFYDLKSRIEKAYLTSRAFDWKHGIFGTGIAVSLIAIFM